jgi:hypothetical protein
MGLGCGGPPGFDPPPAERRSAAAGRGGGRRPGRRRRPGRDRNGVAAGGDTGQRRGRRRWTSRGTGGRNEHVDPPFVCDHPHRTLRGAAQSASPGPGVADWSAADGRAWYPAGRLAVTGFRGAAGLPRTPVTRLPGSRGLAESQYRERRPPTRNPVGLGSHLGLWPRSGRVVDRPAGARRLAPRWFNAAGRLFHMSPKRAWTTRWACSRSRVSQITGLSHPGIRGRMAGSRATRRCRAPPTPSQRTVGADPTHRSDRWWSLEPSRRRGWRPDRSVPV